MRGPYVKGSRPGSKGLRGAVLVRRTPAATFVVEVAGAVLQAIEVPSSSLLRSALVGAFSYASVVSRHGYVTAPKEVVIAFRANFLTDPATAKEGQVLIRLAGQAAAARKLSLACVG